MTEAPSNIPANLLNSKEAAETIRVSERTLREIRKRGLIAYVAVTDRRVMYRPEDCAEYIASRLRRQEPCERPSKPRRTPARKTTGVVIPFETLARQRGW